MKAGWTGAICMLVSLNSHGEAIENCSEIESASQRLACYDSHSDKIKTELDSDYFSEKLGIQPYHSNYVLPVSYHNSNNYYDPKLLFNSKEDDVDIDNLELKLQISFRLPIFSDLVLPHDSVSFAYTQTSFWQLYNRDASKPFRENTYEPELIWQQDYIHNEEGILFNLPLKSFAISFNHQSNGRSSNLSLGWNRLMFNWTFARDNLTVSFKPWIRMPDDDISTRYKQTDDYMGHFELFTGYKMNRHLFSSTIRNNLKTDGNKGYLELNWAFPIKKIGFKGFVQYSYGYGESLIDYRHKVSRLSLGVLLASWQ